MTIIRDNQPELARPHQLFRAMGEDLWASRELAWRLFLRDFKARYRQSFLGYFWVLFPPLALTASFLLLQRANLLNVGDMPIPYPLYALTGMVFWQTLTESIMAPIQIVGQSKAMLVKLQFPRESLILSGILQVTFTFLVRAVILIICLVAFGYFEAGTLLLLPLAFMGTLLLGTMCGIILAPISVLYQDITQGLPMLLSFILVITPVAYLPKSDGVMGLLNTYNPAAAVINFGRASLLPLELNHLPFYGTLLPAFGLALLGWVLYRISIPHLIARIGS